MKIGNLKKNEFELPVDWNGNAAQLLYLGGRTIKVKDSTFVSESSVVRLCNIGTTVATIKLKDIDFGGSKVDIGTSILPTSKEVFACLPGDIFEVTGELDITFIRDKSLEVKRTLTDLNLTLSLSGIGGTRLTTDFTKNPVVLDGSMDFYYGSQTPQLGSIDGNKFGVRFSSTDNLINTPELAIHIYDQFGTKTFGVSDFTKTGNIFNLDYIFLVQNLSFEYRIEVIWWKNSLDISKKNYILKASNNLILNE